MSDQPLSAETSDVTYEVIAHTAAAQRGCPVPRGYESWADFNRWESVATGWSFGVWRCERGVPVELIGEDGGEPEDQVLVRGWDWVAPALQAAYDLGRRQFDGTSNDR